MKWPETTVAEIRKIKPGKATKLYKIILNIMTEKIRNSLFFNI
jgi:hypothetical protein